MRITYYYLRAVNEMVVAAHAVAGATIGSLLKPKTLCRWLLLAVLGIASHIILDFVPIGTILLAIFGYY